MLNDVIQANADLILSSGIEPEHLVMCIIHRCNEDVEKHKEQAKELIELEAGWSGAWLDYSTRVQIESLVDWYVDEFRMVLNRERLPIWNTTIVDVEISYFGTKIITSMEPVPNQSPAYAALML